MKKFVGLQCFCTLMFVLSLAWTCWQHFHGKPDRFSSYVVAQMCLIILSIQITFQYYFNNKHQEENDRIFDLMQRASMSYIKELEDKLYAESHKDAHLQ